MTPPEWVTASDASRLHRVPSWDDRERATLIALLLEQPQHEWATIVAAIFEAGSAEAVWDARHDPSLFDSETLFDSEAPSAIRESADRINEWRDRGLSLHTFRDDTYPAQLREIHQVPPVLFSRGRLQPDERAVSVVGSRRASDAGLAWTKELATALAAAGVTVISGLATGIDTAAHTATLDAGGRTVAVLGTGIDRAYPTENRDLQDEIARTGLVLSQFWPEAPPTKKTFPVRNATMSGYGRATVVVEAGETSGARIQARVGVEHGRPVILTDAVVQGNHWAKALIRRPGVHVVSSPGEALDVVMALRPDVETLLSDLVAGRG